MEGQYISRINLTRPRLSLNTQKIRSSPYPSSPHIFFDAAHMSRRRGAAEHVAYAAKKRNLIVNDKEFVAEYFDVKTKL